MVDIIKAGKTTDNEHKLGWISLHRRLLDNPRFKDPEWLSVWIYLLLNATHKKFPALFKGKRIDLQPGQLITGRLSIAKNTGVNESKVKRLLKQLKIEQQIDQQAGNQNSLITIVNWGWYQKSDQPNGQQLTSNRPAGDQRVTTNNNGDKGNKGKNVNKKKLLAD